MAGCRLQCITSNRIISFCHAFRLWFSVLTLRAAQLFLATADAGTLTAAAGRLHISQPAATKALAQLEARLGGPLFDRQGRRLRLTGLGEALLPRARALVQQAADLEAEARRWCTGQAGALQLGVGPSVEYRLLPDAVAQFYRDGRRVRLTVTSGPAGELVDALRSGRLDLVAADIGAAQADESLLALPMPEETVGAAVRQGHPVFSGAELDQFPIASATPPERLRTEPLPWGPKAPDIVCDDYSVLARACSASDHILAAPDPVIDRLRREHPLVRLDLPDSSIRVKPALIRRAGAPASPALDALCDCFLAIAREES